MGRENIAINSDLRIVNIMVRGLINLNLQCQINTPVASICPLQDVYRKL